MKPISYTTPKPTTTKPSTTQPSTTASGSVKPKEELGERQFMELGGTGTSGDPKIIWVRQSQVFNDKFIAELLGSAKELYTILEVRRSDKAARNRPQPHGCVLPGNRGDNFRAGSFHSLPAGGRELWRPPAYGRDGGSFSRSVQ